MADTSSRASTIKRMQLTSNQGVAVDISPMVTDFSYYESVLSNVITATAVCVETGHGGVKEGTILDGLPIRGGERLDVEVQDFYGETLKLEMYVNRIRNASSGTQKNLYFLDFASKYYFANEQTRVVRAYKDAPISTHVSTIINNQFKGAKINTDETSFNYRFIGNDRKPLYVCTWLASRSVPKAESSGGGGGNTVGGAAGYFFYETRDSFNFRSIDKLFKEDVKRTYKYTATPNQEFNNTKDGKPVYKVLRYNIDSDVDLQSNMTLGTYNNRTIYFDPVGMRYRVVEYNIENQKGKITTADTKEAARLVNESFIKSPTRLMSTVLDIGYNTELDKWKSNPVKANYDAPKTMAQSIMRYNQLFTIQSEVTVSGDLGIRAGDLIELILPEPGEKPEINKKTGGKYMVANVCHKITPTDTFSQYSLVRDSYGKA